MNTIITFAKENYELICLLIGIIGIVIGFISLIHELKEKKKRRNNNSEES